MRKRYWALLVVSVMTALMVSSFDAFNQLDQRAKVQEDFNEPDFYIQGSKIQVYDEQGLVSRVLFADEMKHYPGPDLTELQQPRMSIYSQGQQQWLIQAREGVLKNNQDELVLNGDVILQPLEKSSMSFDLTTEALTLYPERQEAHTKEHVDIKGPGMTMQAVGMDAYFEQQQIQFLSNVRGRHEPN